MHFADRLTQAIQAKQTPLCVGLDPRPERLPEFWRGNLPPTSASKTDLAQIAGIFIEYCRQIIDIVAPLVPCVKPQAAFFEAIGPSGMAALHDVVQYARQSGLLVIMDAKRGDIGSTAAAYASAYLGAESPWHCDSLTVNPYLGDDSLEPFVETAVKNDAGIFVLVKTSNPGSKTLQEHVADGQPIYEHVAHMVQNLAQETKGQCGYGSVCAVVGATYPEQLAELRQKMPNVIFLVPGLGAQGGTAADIAGGFDQNGLGAVINSSRAIIFAYEREEYSGFADNWQKAVEQATLDTIGTIAKQTTAGNLRH